MAQGAVAPALANGASSSLSAEELREILEYERIVQFRDAVLAGTHPRIKIPAHLAGKQNSRNVSSPSSTVPRPNTSAQPVRTTSSSRAEDSSSFYNRSPSNQRAAGGAHIPISSKSEINPILLEKSDDLIKAEIQLQRQRLERGLREQIEQQRIAAKALLQTSESLPNFDLSEVLSKALAIVHPSTTAEAEASGATSDSFDENTFYSSQHDTPEPLSPPEGQKDTAELQLHNAPSLEQHGIYSTQGQVEDREVVMTGASLSNDNNLAMQSRSQMQHSPIQLLNSTSNMREQPLQTSTSDSGISSSNEAISSGAQGTVKVSIPRNISRGAIWIPSPRFKEKVANSANIQATTQDLLKQAFDNVATSPLVRAHNLSPIAPQPARVSPLATARDPPILRDNAALNEMQPVQVSTLRNQQNGLSSTDSSPRGVKGPEKKKEKEKERKKRKRKGKETADTPDEPYIKPEPRSPSPYTAVAPLPRPQKRQRQSGQYAAELNYDEPAYDHTSEVQRIPEQQFREIRAPRTYERVEERYEPEIRRPEPVYRRVEEDDGYGRPAHGQYEKRPQSPAYVTLPYVPSETGRPGEHTLINRRGQDMATKDFGISQPGTKASDLNRQAFRANVRHEADRERSRSPIYRERRSPPIAMAPPRQPMRIVIDEYGRKYYEPLPAASMRQSVAPPTRYREPEVIYERAPVRAVSSRVPTEYERDGVVYRTSSPAPAVPRRVVTQPEYAFPAPPEYRSYRQREYSVRPTTMGPPGEEYIQIRGRPVSPEEPRREYIQRAPSAFPEVRYEIPREYARLQSVRPEAPLREYSVRPEAPPREYAASVRPEARREIIPQARREYSVRPVDAIPIPRREHAIAPEGERYYEEEPLPGRRPAEVAFIERPRARESSVMVYADDVRREVYR